MTGFVNLNGKPISIDPLAKKKARPRESAPKAEVQFFGWFVVGFSPEHLEEARTRHEQEIENARRHNKLHPHNQVDVPGPWNAQTYMNGAKPRKARPKPYETPEGANDCAQLCVRAGWLRVHLVEKRRGG